MTDLAHRAFPHIPARTTAGLEQVQLGPGHTVNDMTAPGTFLDHRGVLATGALAILADSALGHAVMSTMPESMGMVTSHLHLELLRALPPGLHPLRGFGEQRGVEGRFGVGGGQITMADGTPVAHATIGAVLFERRGAAGRGPNARPAVVPPTDPAPHSLIAGTPVHQLLRTIVHRADAAGVELSMPASTQLANSSGGVHGGAGVLMGERTLELALRVAVADGRQYRPVELRAAFVRPIVANDEPVQCLATVMHLGRQLAAVRGEVRDHQGRPAVLVDATYIAEESQ